MRLFLGGVLSCANAWNCEASNMLILSQYLDHIKVFYDILRVDSQKPKYSE